MVPQLGLGEGAEVGTHQFLLAAREIVLLMAQHEGRQRQRGNQRQDGDEKQLATQLHRLVPAGRKSGKVRTVGTGRDAHAGGPGMTPALAADPAASAWRQPGREDGRAAKCWWSRRESNPRPQAIIGQIYMRS